MLPITTASKVNCIFVPSLTLKYGLIVIFSLLICLVFLRTALPLEGKTLLLILLINELKFALTFCDIRGTFFLHIDGECRYQQHQLVLSQIVLLTPWLVIFEATGMQGKQRFFIAQDSLLNKNDYRHLARVLLAAN